MGWLVEGLFGILSSGFVCGFVVLVICCILLSVLSLFCWIVFVAVLLLSVACRFFRGFCSEGFGFLGGFGVVYVWICGFLWVLGLVLVVLCLVPLGCFEWWVALGWL